MNAVPADTLTDVSAPATLSASLADFALQLQYDQIPEPVRERALSLILDALGIALAANSYPFADQMLAGLTALGGSGDCRVIGRPDKLPLRDAITMNGGLIHGLDYDDTHMNSVIHATAATLPAMLGMAEHTGASGREMLTAYVAGMEVAIRLGLVKPFGWHHEGYHATGVVAHFASTLICGRLLGLDGTQLVSAQGIVGSTASASQEFAEEGAWNKRLHPGWGGVAGVTACYLAKSGFVGPSKPYEGRYGVYRMHLGAEAELDLTQLTADLGERYELGEAAIKPYPTCHFTHAAADAALILRERHGLTPDDVANVRVFVPGDTVPVIAEPETNKRRPRSEYDGKFSMHYIAAAALVRGRFGLAELAPESLADPAILAVADRTTCAPDPDTRFPAYYSGGVAIETRAGVTLTHHEPVNRGAGDRALSHAEIEDKFRNNLSLVMDEATTEKMRTHILAMPESDGRAYMAGLAST
ncbi:MAG: MmgE/PrpD family protein [Pseudomonadota bacterium]